MVSTRGPFEACFDWRAGGKKLDAQPYTTIAAMEADFQWKLHAMKGFLGKRTRELEHLEHMVKLSRGGFDMVAPVGEYNAPQLTATQPTHAQLRPFCGGDYARHSGQPKPHDEHSTPVGHHIHSNVPQSSNPLPSHQELRFTPMVFQPYAIKPSKTTSSAKRKLDTRDGQFERGSPKRTRSFGAHGHCQSGQVPPSEKPQDPMATEKAKRSTHRTRTIAFDEVYQKGKAEHKHLIFQYPPGPKGNWWILKCDQHGVHFGLKNPLRGAAAHLRSGQHNKGPCEPALVIRELGHIVWDCTRELADKNNKAVEITFTVGYKPFNQNRRPKIADSETIPVHRTRRTSDSVKVGRSKDCTGVVYPIVAELYLVYWGEDKTWYVVMLLPWGDLGPAGIEGTLTDTGLRHRPPKCYTIDKATREITGWAEGFEDGGRLVAARQFPVMYFDDRRNFGWLGAGDLSIFSFEHPDAHSIPHYHEARDYYAKIQPRRFKSFQHMKDSYAASAQPPKLSSSVGQPPALSQTPEALPASFGTGNAAVRFVDTDPVSHMDIDKSPRHEGSAKVNGYGGQVDIEMSDVSEADDTESYDDFADSVPESDDGTESYHDSADSELESDDDMEMGNAEGGRASVSHNGLDVPSATATTEKQRADPPAVSRDVSAAKTTATASLRIEGSVENAGHDDGGIRHKCDICGKGLATRSSLIMHRRIHTGEKPFECDICKQRFTQSGGLTTHQRTHTWKKPFGCGICRKRFSDYGNCAKHKLNCKKRFSQSQEQATNATATTEKQPADPPAVSREDAEVMNHANNTLIPLNNDEGDIRHKCDICGKRLSNRSSLMRHKRIHTGEEPFECGICGKRFKQSYALTTHKRTHEASAGRESDSSSGAGSGTRNVVRIDDRRSSRESESPSLAAAILPITGVASPPVAAASRTSVLRLDEAAQANRWRVVRSDSGPQVLVSRQPQSSGAASAASSATSALQALPKGASSVGIQNSVGATGRRSSPFSWRMGSEECFEIAHYADDSGGKFDKQEDGPFLRLVVNRQANTCGTNSDQSVQVRINPHDIARVDVYSLDDRPDACLVSLVLKDIVEGRKILQLVFETSKAMGRDEVGRHHARLHARRFCAWLKGVNPEFDYSNKQVSTRPMPRVAGTNS